MVKAVPCPKCGRPIDAGRLKLHWIKKSNKLLLINNRTKCCYEGTCPTCKTKGSYDISYVEEKELA